MAPLKGAIFNYNFKGAIFNYKLSEIFNAKFFIQTKDRAGKKM